MLPVMLALQTQNSCQPGKTCSKAKQAHTAAFLLRRSRRPGAIPAPATTGRRATAVVVLLDVGCLLVCTPPPLAQAEDGEDAIESCFGAAVEANEQEQNDAENDTYDNSGNGTTAQAASALVRLDEGSVGAGGDGRCEGQGGGCRARDCDDGQSRARGTRRCGRGYDTSNYGG